MLFLVPALGVAALNVYAAVLIILRSRAFRTRLYRPMLLNIALSFVPVVGAVVAVLGLLLLPVFVSTVATPGSMTLLVWAYMIVVTALWVLFFPNSIYLITELNFSHRREDDPVPLWYDIVLTLTLTLSGIGNAVLSLALVQFAFIVIIIDPQASGVVPFSSWVFAAIVIFLGSLGVYLGRYLRFNSWDVRHPMSLLHKLAAHLGHRGRALAAFGFVVSHAVLILIIYIPLFQLGYWALSLAQQ